MDTPASNTGLSYQSSCERSDGRLASLGQVVSRSQQVLSSNIIISKFQVAERKNLSLCSPQGLALTGMGQGSGDFSTRLISRLGFLLMKKWWARFTTPG